MQILDHLAIDGAEVRRAVMEVSRGHRTDRGGQQRRRAWCQQAALADVHGWLSLNWIARLLRI